VSTLNRPSASRSPIMRSTTHSGIGAFGWQIQAFTVLVAIVTGLGCGLLPALQVGRRGLLPALAEDARAPIGSGVRTRTARIRALIMSAQVAIACVLLIGALLLTRSFVRLLDVNLGYDPSNVLTARLVLADGEYTPERRLAAAAFWAVLLAPALVAPFTGVRLVSLWSMSAWTLLPVMLLSSPLVMISRRDAAGIVTLAVVFPFVMVALAPAVAFAIHRAGPAALTAHSAMLAAPVERLWRETSDRPLRVFGGFVELADGVPFYLPSHPVAAHVLDGPVSQAMEARIGRDGIVMVCPARDPERPVTGQCVDRAIARARCSLPGMQVEVEVRRRYLGVGGARERYLIVTIPPMQVDKLPPLRDLVAEYAAGRFKTERGQP